MSEKNTLNLQKRQITGRQVKKLRRSGIVPANIFGKKTKSLSVQASQEELLKIYEQAGETSIIYATIDDEKEPRPVLIASLQHHPVTDQILHVDFHQVDLTQKVTATVPIVLQGTAPAVEEKDAVLVQLLNEVEVEALPADLPHEITLDISSLKEIDDSLAIKDLKVDAVKVEIKAQPEELVVQAQEPQPEEEAPAPAEAPAEETAPAGKATETPTETKTE